MAYNADMFDRVTDRLIALLNESGALARSMPGPVIAHKGVFHSVPEETAVYVCLAKVNEWGYWVGGDGTDVTATWWITVACRLGGDPGELERRVATMSANVATAILGHMGDAGYWSTAQLMPSNAINVREETEQRWETVIIPVEISFDLVAA